MTRFEPRILALASAIVLLCLPMSASGESSISDNLAACSHADSHAEERGCMEGKAASSDRNLKKQERALADLIAERDADAADIANALKRFDDSKAAFKAYREKQCAFFKSMAMGGNGGGDLYLACVANLNSHRAAELAWAIENWAKQAARQSR